MNVFVYGTLLVPKIWETVTRTRGLRSLTATLPDHEIRRVREAVYPGIFANPSSPAPVPGRVFFEVPEAAVARLDAYEDDFYLRSAVFPLAEGLGVVEAEAYLVPPDAVGRLLAEEGWTLEWFERHGLEGFWDRVFAE